VGGRGVVLLPLLAFLPSVISSFCTHNKGGKGGQPPSPSPKSTTVLFVSQASWGWLRVSQQMEKEGSPQCPWVLSIMPDWLVRDQWENPRKMEPHYLIKPGQPRRMALTHSFIPFPNPYISDDK